MSIAQLADLLEGSAPDLRLEKVLRAEASKIRESLQVVGQYVMEWEGNLVVIEPAAPTPGEGEGKAVSGETSNHYWWMFTFHEWKAKQVCNRLEPWVHSLTLETRKDVASAKTDILYVCSCGKVKTKTIGGTWKLEDVQP